MSSSSTHSDIVLPEEIEYYVKSIRPYQLHQVGSDKWLACHEMVIKLSQQAILEASAYREEVVKESLVVHSKLKVLIHEAYCILLWKTKVLPHLLSIDPNPPATFLIYTALFHEGAVISLLEVSLFHQNGCECLEEAAIDLVDYCAQSVAQVIGLVGMGYHENDSNVDVDETVLTELERQKRDLIYKIGMRCLSILNYLIDKVDVLSLSASRRVVSTHDIPYLLCDILHFRPWLRKTAKGFQKFIDETWTPVDKEKLGQVSKHEAQTWFCLRQIIFNNNLMSNYPMNESRQQQLAKCQGLLNENLLDQLPVLCDLKQFLCTLTVSGTNAKTKNNLLLEEVPQIKDNIMKVAEKRGGIFQIATDQSDLFLANDKEKIFEIAKRLNVAYNTDMLMEVGETLGTQREELNTKICNKCKKDASKKCANCLTVGYCSRECQIADWSTHKTRCLQMLNDNHQQK